MDALSSRRRAGEHYSGLLSCRREEHPLDQFSEISNLTLHPAIAVARGRNSSPAGEGMMGVDAGGAARY